MSPTVPARVRNRTKSSPRSLMRSGRPPGSCKWDVGTTGIQYWRNKLPIAVAGPTRVSVSFSSRVKLCKSSRRTWNMLSPFITGFLLSGFLGACITRMQAVKYVAVIEGFDSVIRYRQAKIRDRGKEIPMAGTHVTIAGIHGATFDSYVASPVSEKGAGVVIVSTISGV